MKDMFDRIAAQLGHKSTSMLKYYVGGAARASFHGTTLGRCPTGSSSDAQTCHKAPCPTSPMALFEPAVWDFAEYIQANRREKAVTNGLVRSWSDLDRTGALAAHLAALDRTLDS